jgi:hypothetical protein
VTRANGLYGILFDEIPKFINWIPRKYHMYRNTPNSLMYFREDFQKWIGDVKSQAQLGLLSDFIAQNDISSLTNEVDADSSLTALLKVLNYQMFPSKKKIAVTVSSEATVPLLGFLLYSMALNGGETLDINGLSVVIIAYCSMVMTQGFYVRLYLKLYDRIVNFKNKAQEFLLENDDNLFKQIAYFSGFSILVGVVSVATSSGFVFESDQANVNASETTRRLWEILWTYAAGLAANFGYMALKGADIVQYRLDERVVRQHNGERITPKQAAELKHTMSNFLGSANDDLLRKTYQSVRPTTLLSKLSCLCSRKSPVVHDSPASIQFGSESQPLLRNAARL